MSALTEEAPTRTGAVTVHHPGRRRLSGKLLASLILVLLAACFVVPLLWVVLAAFNGDRSRSATSRPC